jgi:aldose 1-epimerase
MGFRVTTREASAGDRRGTVYVLADAADTARAEVWPFTGFNCLRWQVRSANGTWGDLLFAAPDWESNPIPTRSGHPVLFPFPNRLAHGRFQFTGQEYQLPLNDSSGQHAIHGFTPRNPWRVTATEVAATHAAVTGEFQLTRDLPASAGFWPTDFVLQLTYLLAHTSLRVVAEVKNYGPRALPFGLGYHPYFCHPLAAGGLVDDLVMYSSAGSLWETVDGIPTGQRTPVPSRLDFRTPRPIGPANLDTLYTDLTPEPDEDFAPVAWLGHQTLPGRLSVLASPVFRELLLFIPPHRRAVAIEPYTCPSDAANLAARGIETGWVELAEGGQFTATVEYRWDPDTR